MTENKYAGMLHAYALGCLNPVDYSKLLHVISSGEDYPYQDMGEFQNLVALLPSVLEYEVPPKSVKENIARQLYYIKDEAKEIKEKTVKPAIPAAWGDQNTGLEEAVPAEEEISEIPDIEEAKTKAVREQENILEEYFSEIEPAEETEPDTAEIPHEEIVEAEDEETGLIEETAVREEKVSEHSELPAEEDMHTEELEEEAEINAASGDITEEAEEEEIAAEELTEESEREEAAVTEAEKEKPVVTAETVKPEEEIVKPKKEEAKPVRSLGDFLAGAEIKPEDVTGKIEFEDYFAEARKADIQKRQTAVRQKPPVRDTETAPKEKSIRTGPVRNYSDDRSYRSGGSAWGKIFTVVLVIITAAVVYFYLKSEMETLKTDNEKMSAELRSLREITTTDKDILSILGKKDSRIFNLYGSSINSYSYGKVIYSPAENRGYIQAAALPELKENMAYQFWINIGGRNYMVHKFTSATSEAFHPFSLQRVSLNQYMRVFLTEEPFTGSQSPSRTILLSGSN